MELSEIVKKILKELEIRRQECGKGRHIGPIMQITPYMVSSRSDPLRDRVYMVCKHCGEGYYRGLNQREIKVIYKFWRGLRETRITV